MLKAFTDVDHVGVVSTRYGERLPIQFQGGIFLVQLYFYALKSLHFILKYVVINFSMHFNSVNAVTD